MYIKNNTILLKSLYESFQLLPFINHIPKVKFQSFIQHFFQDFNLPVYNLSIITEEVCWIFLMKITEVLILIIFIISTQSLKIGYISNSAEQFNNLQPVVN